MPQLYNNSSPISSTIYDAAYDVQTAMVTRMRGDTALSSKVTGIFDEAPTVQNYPYVAVGGKTQLPFDVFRQVGFDCTVTLDIWSSQFAGDVHSAILNDIYRLFNNPQGGLPLQAFYSTRCYVELTTTRVLESMAVRHTLVRVRTINT